MSAVSAGWVCSLAWRSAPQTTGKRTSNLKGYGFASLSVSMFRNGKLNNWRRPGWEACKRYAMRVDVLGLWVCKYGLNALYNFWPLSADLCPKGNNIALCGLFLSLAFCDCDVDHTRRCLLQCCGAVPCWLGDHWLKQRGVCLDIVFLLGSVFSSILFVYQSSLSDSSSGITSAHHEG